MMHAELAGKTAPHAEDMARREDVLTSTVFGTLFLTDAWPLLMRWMARVVPVGDHGVLNAAADGDHSYWFWPRLRDAEPDLVIRCDAVLLVVEAKYLSGKSGSSSFDGETLVEATDQLVREWRACCAGEHTCGYPPDLAAAIEECELHLVYLVRRGRWVKELRAVQESAAQVPNARMHLLTWEDLDDVLAPVPSRWARELRAYLHARRVASFRGFESAVRHAATIVAWRYVEVAGRQRPRAALTRVHADAASRLAGAPRRLSGAAASQGWDRLLTRTSPVLLSALAGRSSAFSSREVTHG